MFAKLRKDEDSYFITQRKDFKRIGIFKDSTIKKCFNFAWDMTFGTSGEHRSHRSGGQYGRKNGEKFINTLQGKLSELAVYNLFYKNQIQLSDPDFETYGLGEWDDSDFIYNNLEISVKSTAHFGNLLLLETKDWDEKGIYLPNEKAYDHHILVRIEPDGKRIMKSQGFMYSMEIEKDRLWSIISNEIWAYDIPGYINNHDLKEIIKNNYILPQNASLNGRVSMDAENYYVQSGDLRAVDCLFKEIK